MMPSSSILQKISIFGILYPQELFIRLKMVYDENKTNVTFACWKKRQKLGKDSTKVYKSDDEPAPASREKAGYKIFMKYWRRPASQIWFREMQIKTF